MEPLLICVANFKEAPRAASTLHEFIYFSLNNSQSSLPQQYSFSILLTLPNPLLFSLHLFNHFLTDYTVIIAKCQEPRQLIQMPLFLPFSPPSLRMVCAPPQQGSSMSVIKSIPLASVIISTFSPCLSPDSSLPAQTFRFPYPLKQINKTSLLPETPNPL